MIPRHLLASLSLIVLAMLSSQARAEQSQDFGEYVVHYSAVTTDQIPPQIASAYNIQRSSSNVLLNITVLRKVMGASGTPVEARVTANAINLTNQQHDITMREVKEDGAIYYLGTLGVENRETYDFTAKVSPKGDDQVFTVKFRQQFFTE